MKDQLKHKLTCLLSGMDAEPKDVFHGARSIETVDSLKWSKAQEQAEQILDIVKEDTKNDMNMFVQFLLAEGILSVNEDKPQNFEFLYSVWSGENPDGLL